MSAFLEFIEAPNPGKKTKAWMVTSKIGGTHLGWVHFYAPWRRYTFSAVNGTLFDANCIRDIANFLDDHRSDRQ